jgi:hypothetical protein
MFRLEHPFFVAAVTGSVRMAFCPGNRAKTGMFLVVGVFCPGNRAETGIKSSFRPH